MFPWSNHFIVYPKLFCCSKLQATGYGVLVRCSFYFLFTIMVVSGCTIITGNISVLFILFRSRSRNPWAGGYSEWQQPWKISMSERELSSWPNDLPVLLKGGLSTFKEHIHVSVLTCARDKKTNVGWRRVQKLPAQCTVLGQRQNCQQNGKHTPCCQVSGDHLNHLLSS